MQFSEKNKDVNMLTERIMYKINQTLIKCGDDRLTTMQYNRIYENIFEVLTEYFELKGIKS